MAEYTGTVIPTAKEYHGEVLSVGAGNTPSTQTFTQKLLSNPVVRGAYGLAEGGTAALAGLGASAVGGINGINTLLGGGSLDDAAKSIENMQDKAFQPKTAEGITTAHLLSLPVEKAADIAGKFGGGIQGLANGQGFNRGAANAPLEGEGVTDTRNTDLGHMVGNVGVQTAATLMGARPVMRAANSATAGFRQFDPLQAQKDLAAGLEQSRSPKAEAARLAVENNIKIIPSDANPTIANRIGTSIANKKSAEVAFSKENEVGYANMAKQAIGLPKEAPLNKVTIEQVRNEAGLPMEEIRKLGTIEPSPTFIDDVAKLYNPQLIGEPPAIVNLVNETIQKTGGATDSNVILDNIRNLRETARTTFNQDHPSIEETRVAKVSQGLADALEKRLDYHLEQSGNTDLMNAYRAGRERLAKSYIVGDALDNNTQILNPNKIAKLTANGANVTDEIANIGKIAGNFPNTAKINLDVHPLEIHARRWGVPGMIGGLVGGVPGAAIGMGLGETGSAIQIARMLKQSGQEKGLVKDFRSMQERMSNGQPMPSDPVPPFKMGFDDSPLPQSPQAPMPQGRGLLSLSDEQPQAPMQPYQGGVEFPLQARNVPLYQRGGIPQETGMALSPPEPSMPSISYSTGEVPVSRGLLSTTNEPFGTSKPQFQPQSGMAFQLRQDVLQHPEIVKATEAFSKEANRLQNVIANSQGVWKVRATQELNALQDKFDAGMKQLGIETRGDANGIARALYQGQEGKTQLPIEKTFSKEDLKAIAEQLRK